MILDKVSFVMPMPHSTSALYIETFHCLRQIDLPLIVLLLKLVLNLLKHLPHRCLHILLCHQASAQLLGDNQWERLRHCLYWCRLRLCLGCGRLLRSAWTCLCCSGSALRCAHSSCPFCCISFNHRSLCPLRCSRSIRSPCGSATPPVSWTFCHQDCTANVQSRFTTLYGLRWNSIKSNANLFKDVRGMSFCLFTLGREICNDSL